MFQYRSSHEYKVKLGYKLLPFLTFCIYSIFVSLKSASIICQHIKHRTLTPEALSQGCVSLETHRQLHTKAFLDTWWLSPTSFFALFHTAQDIHIHHTFCTSSLLHSHLFSPIKRIPYFTPHRGGEAPSSSEQETLFLQAVSFLTFWLAPALLTLVKISVSSCTSH